MKENRILVDDWIQGEIIEWNGHSGYVNFISHECITMCIREYSKPEEVAQPYRTSRILSCLLLINTNSSSLTVMNRYCIEVDRIERDGSIFHLVQYRELKPTKSTKGLNRQLNKLTDRIEKELHYYQVPFKSFSVSHVN